MDLDKIGRFVSTVGFPIAVALFLLLRTDPVLRELTESITRLTIVMETKLK
jgi:YvrJ-like protein